ncbi:MAG: chain-length determining protein [Prevotella sp.]|nr:chain-length determining protein [Prevotella sp.]
MVESKENDVIDVGRLIKKIWARRKLFFYRVWPITFVLASLYIVCIPRYYNSEAKLAPEMAVGIDMAGVNSLASSFGFDLGNMQSTDAINPMLYPDLMEDNGFVTSLFTIRVKTADGETDTDYYDYLKNYQKRPWWGNMIKAVTKAIKSLLPKKKTAGPANDSEKSPYWLSEEENSVAETVRGNIKVSLNEKTGIITVKTTSQDPLVARILADSVQIRLQQFITRYRTNKARIDVEHYEKLAQEKKQEYEDICNKYDRFSEANTNIVMTSYKTKRENLQKEMQFKYSAYTSIAGQLEAAKAKLQERTPAFTQLKGAAVVEKPAGPKRMLFVIFMLVLTTMFTTTWIARHDLTKMIGVR